jgi:actin-related protein
MVLPIVFDQGSYSFKAGFGTDEKPELTFPTKYYKTKYQKSEINNILENTKNKVGFINQEQRGLYKVESPIIRGSIVNFDQIQGIITSQ